MNAPSHSGNRNIGSKAAIKVIDILIDDFPLMAKFFSEFFCVKIIEHCIIVLRCKKKAEFRQYL